MKMHAEAIYSETEQISSFGLGAALKVVLKTTIESSYLHQIKRSVTSLHCTGSHYVLLRKVSKKFPSYMALYCASVLLLIHLGF